MTCIVGYVARDREVWMGGDSAGVSGYDLRIRRDAKVFHVGPFLIGICGSFRMGNLLRFGLPLDELVERATGLEDDDYQVAVPAEPYTAIGCAADFALGALAVTDETTEGVGIRGAITLALMTAEKFSAGVRAPFLIEKQPAPGGHG